MSALRKLWYFISTHFEAIGRPVGFHGVVPNDLAALRLYSLPRGVRQRSRASLLHV